MTEPRFHTARDLGAAIRRREISSLAATEARLDRIESLNPRLLAFITVTRAHALSRARQADEELARGHDRGPLHGPGRFFTPEPPGRFFTPEPPGKPHVTHISPQSQNRARPWE